MMALIDLPTIQNPLLRQAELKIEASVGQGQARADYLKVVVAGMRAALAKGPDGILASVNKSPDPVRDAAMGAVNLVLYLRHISRGTMPPRTIIPAATTLMLQALDFIDHAGIEKVGQPELVRATHILTNRIFQAFGITMPMLNKAAGAVHGLTQDPKHMAAIQRQMPPVPQGEA